MTIEDKVRRLPLSLESMRLRDENIRRCREFKKRPPEEKPAPVARDRVADYKPEALAASLLDLAEES